MNTSQLKLLMGICGITLGFTSCQKDNSITTQTKTTLVTAARQTAKTETDGLATKLTLIPDSADGQDTYVSKILHNASDGNANLNFAKELVMATWKIGNPNKIAVARGYIRFDSLSKIPAGAKIVSAVLYLYGESSSVSYPNGNSFYPGGHTEDNSCIVQRVTGGTWNQTTLTWNTMPGVLNEDSAIIPASTTEWHYNASTDVTVMVKKMLNQGKNYGFCIRLINESIYRDLLFSTSEAANENLRPKLVVRYK